MKFCIIFPLLVVFVASAPVLEEDQHKLESELSELSGEKGEQSPVIAATTVQNDVGVTVINIDESVQSDLQEKSAPSTEESTNSPDEALTETSYQSPALSVTDQKPIESVTPTISTEKVDGISKDSESKKLPEAQKPILTDNPAKVPDVVKPTDDSSNKKQQDQTNDLSLFNFFFHDFIVEDLYSEPKLNPDKDMYVVRDYGIANFFEPKFETGVDFFPFENEFREPRGSAYFESKELDGDAFSDYSLNSEEDEIHDSAKENNPDNIPSKSDQDEEFIKELIQSLSHVHNPLKFFFHVGPFQLKGNEETSVDDERNLETEKNLPSDESAEVEN